MNKKENLQWLSSVLFGKSIASEILEIDKNASVDELCLIIRQITHEIIRIKILYNISYIKLFFIISSIFTSIIVQIERVNKLRINEESLFDLISSELEYLRSKIMDN